MAAADPPPTDPGRAKEDLLVRAARALIGFHESLDGLGETDLTDASLDGWSIRDILAHLSGWHREMTPALERLARGERPFPEGVRYDDVDAWNARFATAAREVEVTDLLLQLDRTHQEFLAAAATVPAERFAPDRTAYRIVDLNSAHHYRTHADQIRAWRATRGR